MTDAPDGTGVARATALVVLAAAGFGAISVLVSLALRTGAPLASVLAWRYLLGSGLLVIAAGGLAPVRATDIRARRLAAIAGGAQALIAFVSLSALRYLPAATLVFLFYSYPSWIALFAALRGQERLTLPRVSALALSLAGITVLVGAPSAGTLHPIGVTLALTSALGYALYVPLLARLQGTVGSALASALVTGGAGAFILLGALATGQLTVALAPAAWGAVVALAFVSTLVAFLAFMHGLAVLGPVRSAIVSTIEPFCTAVLGALLLDQRLTRATFAGGLMIAAAVIVLQRGARR